MPPISPERSDSTGPGTFEIVLSAVSVVLITIGLSTAGWWATGQPASEYPAWLEAGATLAAVGAAIVAGFYAARAFGLEFQRERRWEENQMSSQASLVAAWPEGAPWLAGSGDECWVYGAVAKLRNASPLPVSAIVVSYWLVFTDEHIEREPVLFGAAELAYLPPEDQPYPLQFQFDEPEQGVPLTETLVDYAIVAVEIQFRDAGGTVWRRDRWGGLRPLWFEV